MLYDFVATLAVALGAGGLGLAIRHLSGWRLPRWLVPALVGAGIIGFTVWNEYSWYGRTRAALPATVSVVSAPADRVFYRPWTYAVPLITRFVAVDSNAVVRSKTDPALRVASVQVVQRWTATRAIPMAFDCSGNRMADMMEGAAMTDDGGVTGVTWRETPADEPILNVVCQGG